MEYNKNKGTNKTKHEQTQAENILVVNKREGGGGKGEMVNRSNIW